MKLSAKTEYACLALLQLADDFGKGQPTPLRSLCERQAIPEGFLVQILQQLRRAGLVVSTRGSCGGYQLARRPGEVSLAEAIEAIDGPPPELDRNPGPTPHAEVLREVCRQQQQAQQQRLGSLTLEELVERASAPTEMWYI